MAADGIIRQSGPAAAPKALHFPDSDARFLPENPLQARAIISVRNDLQQHFLGVDNGLLEGSMFLYFDPGDSRSSVSPDAFVVQNHDLGDRQTYKVWEEGKPPDFVLDVISPSSEAGAEPCAVVSIL